MQVVGDRFRHLDTLAPRERKGDVARVAIPDVCTHRSLSDSSDGERRARSVSVLRARGRRARRDSGREPRDSV